MTTELQTLATTSRQIGLTPQNIEEALRLAEVMAGASIVPKDYQGNPGNILVAIQWGAELGLPPLQAMQNIAVINGRPAVWGDAVIAIVRRSGLLESFAEDIGDTSATCTVQRKGEPPTSRTFSVEDAKRAGLWGKQGPWTQYPKRMLQIRARAWALRDTFPDVLRGVSVAEEAQDIPTERNMGPAQVVEPPSDRPPSRAAEVKAKLRRRALTPGPGLDMVLQAIDTADTPDALNQVAGLAARLGTDKDKATARAAYARRKTQLTDASAAEESETDPESSNADVEAL